MTNPSSVYEYIGCYAISFTLNGSCMFVNRTADGLACTATDIQDAALFAFYLGDFVGTAADSGNLSTLDIYQLQVQLMLEGTWVDSGKMLDGKVLDGYAVALTSPDEAPPFKMWIKSTTGIPQASDNIVIAYVIWGTSYVFDAPPKTTSAHWVLGIAGFLIEESQLFVNAHPIFPGMSGLTQQSRDGFNFGYLFLNNASFGGVRVTNCNLSNVTFKGDTKFTGTVLDGSNFSGCKLDGAIFHGASLKNVDFSGASLKGCDFTGAVLDNCNLERADLTGANLALATIADPTKPIRITRSVTSPTIFTNACVNKALTHSTDGDGDDIYDWSFASMEGASFQVPAPDDTSRAIPDGQLEGLIARYADLTRVRFSDASPLDLRYADLSYSQLGGAALARANMEYAKFDSAIFSTPDGQYHCDLSKAILTNATFRNADMSYAQMPYCFMNGNGVTLDGANIQQVDFTGAYLVAADFSGLKGKNAAAVTFDGACLVNADFTGTALSTIDNLRAASFANACLQGAKFSNASAQGVNFAGAAVSTSSGKLTVIGGREDGSQISYAATVTPEDTDGATCPSGQAGPCTGAMWTASDAPMTEWHDNNNS